MLPDLNAILQALVSPAIYWLYELVGICLYFFLKFFGKFQKDHHVIMDKDRNGTWHQLGDYFVNPLKDTFRSKSGRTFSTEREQQAYVENTISGSRPVIFHDFGKARPRPAEIEKKGNKIKLNIHEKLPVGQSDPKSTDFDDLIAREAAKQAVAGASGSVNYGKLMLVMMLGIGLLAGAFVVLIVFPHGAFPIAAQTGPIVNGTVPK